MTNPVTSIIYRSFCIRKYQHLINIAKVLVNAKIVFGEKIGIVECAIDHKKESCVVFYGEKGKVILKPLHRPLHIEVILNDKTVIDEHINYEYDDFYSEIAHFNSLIENHQLESNIMSLDSSVNCAKILSAIKERL